MLGIGTVTDLTTIERQGQDISSHRRDAGFMRPPSASAQPGDVYGDSLAVFEARSPWRLAELHGLPVAYRLRQVIGTQDSTLQPNRDFDQHLGTLGIAHDYVEVAGVGHSVPDLVAALGDGFWVFYREALRAVAVVLDDGFE